MNIVFVLLPLSIGLGLVFLVAYLWSARTGQFDDLDTPAVRIIADDHDVRGETGGTAD